jgi:hypothetical protein
MSEKKPLKEQAFSEWLEQKKSFNFDGQTFINLKLPNNVYYYYYMMCVIYALSFQNYLSSNKDHHQKSDLIVEIRYVIRKLIQKEIKTYQILRDFDSDYDTILYLIDERTRGIAFDYLENKIKWIYFKVILDSLFEKVCFVKLKNTSPHRVTTFDDLNFIPMPIHDNYFLVNDARTNELHLFVVSNYLEIINSCIFSKELYELLGLK